MNLPIIGRLLKYKVSREFKFCRQQNRLFMDFFERIFEIKPNSEICFSRIFYYPKFGAKQSILKKLRECEFNFKIQIYYGEYDWIDIG